MSPTSMTITLIMPHQIRIVSKLQDQWEYEWECNDHSGNGFKDAAENQVHDQ